MRPYLLGALAVAWVFINQLVINGSTAVELDAPGWVGPVIATALVMKLAGDLFKPRASTEAFRIGAEGEERVGRALNRFRDQGWIVLHDIPLREGGNIDHLVISPGGIHVVETKNLRGEVTWKRGTLSVGSRRRPGLLEQTARQKKAVAAKLNTPVRRSMIHSYLCFPRARVRVGLFGGGRVRGVRVGSIRYVTKKISRVTLAA